MSLCERAPAYQGVMRARAESQDQGDDPDQLHELDEEAEDEVEPQDLAGLSLGMEVNSGGHGGDGAGVAGEGA